jgi:hypothetical protein
MGLQIAPLRGLIGAARLGTREPIECDESRVIGHHATDVPIFCTV